MVEKHWLDNVIEKYGNSGENDHSTGTYEWKYGANGTDSDGNGKIEYDCSHFLNKVLNEIGHDNPYQSSSALKNSSYYDGVGKADLQKGDVVLFNGHVGFFYGYDDKGNMLVYSSSGNTRTGADRGPGITPASWFGAPTKFLRPKPVTQPGLPSKPTKSPIITRRDPLIFDIDGDGIKTVGLDAGIHFDHDGNGFKELTGWVAPGDGMLMLDRNASGSLDSGSELFGDFTSLQNGMLAVNGFQALAQYDINGDGKIDADDPIWTQLKIWQYDPEATDLADPDESGIISTLDELGITAIYLNSTIVNKTDDSGNTEVRAGHFEWSDGRSSTVSEYSLQRNNSDSISTSILDVPSGVSTLPELQGYGNVYNLQQAMIRDTSGQLKALVEQFVAAIDITDRAAILEQIIFKWTGVDTVTSTAYGQFMDGRKVAALAKFYGDQPTSLDSGMAILWQDAYHELFEIFYSELMSKSNLKGFYDQISYSFDESAGKMKGDLSSVIVGLKSELMDNYEQGKVFLSEFARSLRGLNLEDAIDYLSFRETFISQDESLGWVIDSAGLKVFDQIHTGTRGWSPHMEGTDNADAVKGSLTEGDGYINGLAGNDVIYGTDRDEHLINETGDALLVGGGGNDVIWAGAGNDTLDGGTGNDMLYGETGNDTYIFRRGSGQDTIIDTDATSGNIDTIWLGSNLTAADITARRELDDLVLKITGTIDRLTVKDFFKNDSALNRIERIQFADGTVWTDSDVLSFNNLLTPTDGDDIIYGGSGKDSIRGLAGNDALYGLGGNDILQGDAGNDILYGGTGDDALQGGSGTDYLYGGAGWNDYGDASVSNGNDTYLFGRGAGPDTIIDYDKTAGNVDTIILDSDISPSDVTLKHSGDDLVLSISGTTDTLTVSNWFRNESNEYQVERIQFADGTVWDVSAIRQMAVTGTSGDDVLVGYSTADAVHGFAGNDQLYGRAGDDTLDGGEGNDYLIGENGNDFLQGDAGSDSLYGGTGDDTLQGGSGTDYLYGGAGWKDNWNDSVSNGNDTYLFGRGSGQDTIIDYDKTAGNLDTILLDADILPADVTLMHRGDDLVLAINGTSDTLIVQYWFWNDSTDHQVEQITFADGTVWDVSAIRQMAVTGTSGDDVLVGYSTADAVHGFAGNDQLYGRAGDDTLDGGGGNDYLVGESGNDSLQGGEGSDYLYGSAGDDTLDGGAGNDYLYGGSYWDHYGSNSLLSNGNDTYLFGRGSGQDTIVDYDKTAGNLDTILLDSDIAPADVLLRRDGDNLVLSINGSSDTMTVSDWFLNESITYQVEQIRFADGTVWDAAAIKQMALQGTPGDDVLTGYSTPDFINGLEGNDQLYGRAGDDTLDGGAGSDSLYGEAGNDTYLFGRGSGQDTILDNDLTVDNLDSILLDSDISPTDVTLRRSGNDLVLSVNDASDNITVSKWFFNETADFQVENIRFADGTVWDAAAIKQIVLQGTPGDDYLIGYSSADILDGGAGNDTLVGTKGNDMYVFGRGYGHDAIIDMDSTSGNTDIVNLSADVLPADVTLRRGGDDLFIMINGTSDRLQIKNWFSSDDNKVEYIRFADGTLWDTSVMQNAIDHPTDSDDYLVGTTEADVIDGGGGNDEIYGLEGNDTLYGGTGDDYIDDYSGNNVLYGDDGNDNLYAGWGDDIIYGGAGNDYIQAGDGNNYLYGGDGIDSLYGGTDINFMDGGAGDDYLEGNNGENTFIVNRGGGFDQIHTSMGGSVVPTFAAMAVAVTPDPTPAEEADTVFFGEGITPEMLRIQVNDGSTYGGDLRIAIGTGIDEGILISGQGGNGGDRSLASVGAMAVSTGETPQLTDLPVKRFVFADGQELTLEQIIAQADDGIIGYQSGTDSNDSLFGSVADDEIYGNNGDDLIDGRDNEDYIAGGDGNDIISAGSGHDEVWEGAGNDVTAGGKGNDYLYGESGSDVYCFNRGDGRDYIYDNSLATSSDIDTISFGTTINPEDIAAYINTDGNLVLTINGSEDSISIDWFNPNGYAAYPDAGIDHVQFISEDGSARIFDLTGVVTSLKDSLIASDSNNPVSLFTNSGFELTGSMSQAGGDYAVAYAQTDDLFAIPAYYDGSAGDDVINGRAGDDIIAAGDGNNIINAGDGDNTITSGSGNDTIIAGTGNDTINAGDGNNNINTGAGNDAIVSGIGSDLINAGSGNDILKGGGGGDILIGESGDDTYYYNAGYGAVTIDDLADTSGGNRIVFGEGITPDSLSLTAVDGFLIINTGGDGDAIKLSNFSPDDAYGSHAIETYEFADGQILTYQQLIDKGFEFVGTVGEDILTGTAADDRIDALGGDDVLAGGKGNDSLIGGSGDDVYVFNLGDGVDTINDRAAANAGNSVQFGEGIRPSDLTLTASQNNLIIQVGQGGDALHLEGFNPDNISDDPAVSVFRFADGSMISYGQLISRGFTFTGTAGNDELIGTNVNDTFIGGQGNDSLSGGTGDDTYVFNPGDGIDTITDEAVFMQSNVLIFGSGIEPEDISLSHDPENKYLIINAGNNNDSIRLTGFDSSDPYGSHAIEYFQFSNGQIFTYSQLIDRCFDIVGTVGNDSLSGTATTDRIIGAAGNDTLSGAAGNDILAGGDGDDTYLFNLGDGVDVIDDVATASDGNTLVFGEGITLADMRNRLTYSGDNLIIRIGDNGDEVHLKGFDPVAADTGSRAVQTFRFADGTFINYDELVQNTFIIQGDYGDDYLIGTNVGDRLYGYEGFDSLSGGASDDVITGGVGNDELLGGSGSDTYVFNLGDGVDTITDTSTFNEGNSILFGEGITKDDLTFIRGNRTLTINVGADGDAINLLNFDQDEIAGSLVVRTLEFSDGTQMNLTDFLNRAPVAANPIESQAATEDAAFSFTIPGNTFVDPDSGDTLTYSATFSDGTVLPSWLTFDPATMTFCGTPTNENVGLLSLKVTATDMSGASVSSSFDIEVTNVNDAPIVANQISNQTIMEDAVFSFTVPGNTFADIDAGDTFTYGATLADGTALPSWLTFNAATMAFSGIPTNDDVGTLSLKVTATDLAGASVSSSFNIDVANVNDAPVVANPLLDQTITEDAVFTFVIPTDTFADVDLGDTLTYSATFSDGTVLPSWLTFDPATMTFSGTPANDDIGELSLKVTATDTSGVSAASDFNVTVQPVVNYGTNHTDLIITGSKRDFINALGGSDIVYTGEGNDTIYGGDGTDLLCGDGGDDVIFGENDTDILFGGNGDDTLDGGADGDIMLGGAGDDTYMVDNARDIVTEYHNAGTDAVWSSITYTIDSNIENLTLTGTAAINGTGNNLDNIITGNSAANTLTGDKGDDTLSGGAGNDTLDGGKGSDTYLFSRTDGLDTIIDTKKTNTDTDTLKLTGDITTTEPVLVKQNNDLYVFINSDNYMKIVNEFQQTNYGIERLEVSDGHYITRADIETIVDTMSAINNDSGMDVMQKYNAMIADQTYQNILAQSWQ